MNIGYNFPFNNGGRIEGINNSGIETFKGSPKYYLTKETIQNALDAKANTITPVIVEYKLKQLPVDKFPYIDNLKEIIKKCIEFWRNDNKTQKFMKNALEVLEKDTIPILEIADYNTTGLLGAKQFKQSCFSNLVKSAGVSNKSENDGGSFGIGKNAPFTCSQLRTVIYSTLDNENVRAVQGVSNMVTHKRENRLTQGIGFLGIEKENKFNDIENLPFIDDDVYKNLDEYFIRQDIGTSLFVTGFDIENNWEQQIIQSAIDHYFVAIVDKKLEVKVSDTIINSETIGSLLEKYKNTWKNKLTIQYYKALTSKVDNKKFYVIENKNFQELGKISLHLYLDDNLLKKIAYVRANGMKIIDKDRFRVTTEFSGVLKFEGIEINKFIKALENPSHDKIQYERYERKSYAKNILSNLNSWIREQILKLDKCSTNEAIDAHGIGEFLPDSNGNSKLNISMKDIVNKKLEEIKMNEILKIKRTIKKVKSDEETIHTTKKINKSTNTNNTNNENKDNDTTNISPINIEKSRIFCLDSSTNKYRVILKGKDKGNTYIKFKIICEDGYEIASIQSAHDIKDGHAINIDNNLLGPVRFKKGEKRIFDVVLNTITKYAMEVSESANNI